MTRSNGLPIVPLRGANVPQYGALRRAAAVAHEAPAPPLCQVCGERPAVRGLDGLCRPCAAPPPRTHTNGPAGKSRHDVVLMYCTGGLPGCTRPAQPRSGLCCRCEGLARRGNL